MDCTNDNLIRDLVQHICSQPVINLKILNHMSTLSTSKWREHCKKSPETRGLASQVDVFCHRHTPNPQKVPQVPNPHYMSTFRAFVTSVHIYQDANTSLSLPLRDRHVSGSLHQQHPNPCGIQGEALNHAEGMVYQWEFLGFVVNKEKSVPGKEYPHHSTTPPGVTEYNCWMQSLRRRQTDRNWV